MERGVNNLISVSTCRDREGTLTRLESARILQHLCTIKKQTKCPLDNCYSLAGGKMSKSLITLPMWGEAITYQASASNVSRTVTSLFQACPELTDYPVLSLALYHGTGAFLTDRQGR